MSAPLPDRAVEWHRRPFGAFVMRVAGVLVGILVAVVGSTYRWRFVDGAAERLEGVMTPAAPRVVSFWHNRSVLAAAFLYRQVLRRGGDLTILASLSRDGELVNHTATKLGARVVRGSSSRGGLAALRAMYKIVRRVGTSPVVIPDGPRGPAYTSKPGAVVLSQMTRAPILPLGFAASRFSTIGSWDRLILPWPWARISVAVGPALEVASDLDSEAIERETAALTSVLSEVTVRAESDLGVEDPMMPSSS